MHTKDMYRKISFKASEFVCAEHTLQFLTADETKLQLACSLSKFGRKINIWACITTWWYQICMHAAVNDYCMLWALGGNILRNEILSWYSISLLCYVSQMCGIIVQKSFRLRSNQSNNWFCTYSNWWMYRFHVQLADYGLSIIYRQVGWKEGFTFLIKSGINGCRNWVAFWLIVICW